MGADIKFVNISGTRLAFIGSHAVTLSVLCGVNGDRVVPLATMADGTLLVSGPQ